MRSSFWLDRPDRKNSFETEHPRIFVYASLESKKQQFENRTKIYNRVLLKQLLTNIKKKENAVLRYSLFLDT